MFIINSKGKLIKYVDSVMGKIIEKLKQEIQKDIDDDIFKMLKQIDEKII